MMEVLHSDALHSLGRQAAFLARRIAARSPTLSSDWEDLRQDLLLDFLSRMPAYRPSRGALNSFAAVCFHHRGTRLAAQRRRAARQRAPIQFDAPLPGGEALTLADTLSEAESYSAWMGQPTNTFDQFELRIDLRRALAALPPTDQSICRGLMRKGDTDDGGYDMRPRTTMFRRLRDLRMRLLVAGVQSSPVGVTGRSAA